MERKPFHIDDSVPHPFQQKKLDCTKSASQQQTECGTGERDRKNLQLKKAIQPAAVRQIGPKNVQTFGAVLPMKTEQHRQRQKRRDNQKEAQSEKKRGEGDAVVDLLPKGVGYRLSSVKARHRPHRLNDFTTELNWIRPFGKNEQVTGVESEERLRLFEVQIEFWLAPVAVPIVLVGFGHPFEINRNARIPKRTVVHIGQAGNVGTQRFPERVVIDLGHCRKGVAVGYDFSVTICHVVGQFGARGKSFR